MPYLLKGTDNFENERKKEIHMNTSIKEIQPVIENKVNEFSRTAMIDKLVLSGVAIQEIDNPEYLEKRGILCNGKSKMKYYTKSGNEFTSLSIKDDFFGNLKAGVNYGAGCLYSSLSTSIKKKFCSNLICNTVDDYKKQIENTKKYLSGMYGIYADFKNAVINSIEINRTFKIDNSITDYKRPIELIAWNIPRKKRMDLVQDFKRKTENGFKTETFVITSRKIKKNKYEKTKKSKQYEELVFYDKTKQLEKIIFLSEVYMRFEIKITGSAKIKKMIGTNKFYELTDQSINDFFNYEIKELIIDPYAAWKEKRDKSLLKLLKSQRSEKHDWVVNTLLVLANEELKNGVPFILDVSEVIPLIDRMGIKDPKRRYRIRENFKNQAKRKADVFCNNDDKKLLELLHKLQDTDTPVSSQSCNDAICICHSGDMDKTA